MEKSEQKKLVGKIIQAADIISKKGRTAMDAGIIYAPWAPIAGIYPYTRKKVMLVKEWLEERRKNQHIEAELTRIIAEEIAKEIRKKNAAEESTKVLSKKTLVQIISEEVDKAKTLKNNG